MAGPPQAGWAAFQASSTRHCVLAALVAAARPANSGGAGAGAGRLRLDAGRGGRGAAAFGVRSDHAVAVGHTTGSRVVGVRRIGQRIGDRLEAAAAAALRAFDAVARAGCRRRRPVQIDAAVAVRRRGQPLRRGRRLAQVRLEHEQAFADAGGDDAAAAGKAVVVPGAVERGAVARRIGVEVGDFGQLRVGQVVDAQDAHAGFVVGLVDVLAVHVEVVVDHRQAAVVVSHQHRRVEVGDVPHVGPRGVRRMSGGRLRFVQLVVDQQVAVVLGQPALVRIRGAVVGRRRQRDRRALVAHVDDRDALARAVRVEADLLAGVLGVGSGVDPALRFVRVSAGRHAAGVQRRAGRTHVEDLQAAARGVAGAGDVGAGDHRVAGLFVDRDRVAAAERAVVGVLGEGLRRGHAAQAGQVEHLQAVAGIGVADDVGAVAVYAHVAPGRTAGAGVRGSLPR